MSETQFLDAVREAMERYPEWRYGQAVFNVLFDTQPDIANRIRGTERDPFYLDERVPAVLATVWPPP